MKYSILCSSPKHLKVVPAVLATLLTQIEEATNDQNEDVTQSPVKQLSGVLHTHVEHILQEFRDHGRSNSPTFSKWDDFVFRVMLLIKTFIASTRNGQWETYQSSKAHLLPLLFASNRTTYARYMPDLLIMMQQLPAQLA